MSAEISNVQYYKYTLDGAKAVNIMYPETEVVSNTFLGSYGLILNDFVQIVAILGRADAKGLTMPSNIILNIALMCLEKDDDIARNGYATAPDGSKVPNTENVIRFAKGVDSWAEMKKIFVSQLPDWNWNGESDEEIFAVMDDVMNLFTSVPFAALSLTSKDVRLAAGARAARRYFENRGEWVAEEKR